MKSRKQVSLVGTRSPIKRSWTRIISAIHDPKKLSGIHDPLNNMSRAMYTGSIDVHPLLMEDPRLLRQAALEVLTRSARTNTPRKTRPEQFPAKIVGGGGGGVS
ncbi:bZIP transcription factor 60 [Dorcoceras hygrometricum]|uniref:BZIP transcription factor 60 n=1 Tax=Dorcoceras hygrometricum TaxID=472368 RepID=A0A2Z7DEI0_9LAMI|nr:bZIP transcription factor 60 [Dorcoceras hygrometricum]